MNQFSNMATEVVLLQLGKPEIGRLPKAASLCLRQPHAHFSLHQLHEALPSPELCLLTWVQQVSSFHLRCHPHKNGTDLLSSSTSEASAGRISRPLQLMDQTPGERQLVGVPYYPDWQVFTNCRHPIQWQFCPLAGSDCQLFFKKVSC